MAHKNDKSITNKIKREFDIEEEFQDSSRANAKVSEPSRTTQNTDNKAIKKGGSTKEKKM